MTVHQGTRGHGQWFHPMRGSDVWVNLGRTFHATSKADAFTRLAKLWSAFKGLSPPVRTPSELYAKVGKWITIKGSHNAFTFLGFDLGYDSVQIDNDSVQIDNHFVPDFVIGIGIR
jgi:hypothetical protein